MNEFLGEKPPVVMGEIYGDRQVFRDERGRFMSRANVLRIMADQLSIEPVTPTQSAAEAVTPDVMSGIETFDVPASPEVAEQVDYYASMSVEELAADLEAATTEPVSLFSEEPREPVLVRDSAVLTIGSNEAAKPKRLTRVKNTFSRWNDRVRSFLPEPKVRTQEEQRAIDKKRKRRVDIIAGAGLLVSSGILVYACEDVDLHPTAPTPSTISPLEQRRREVSEVSLPPPLEQTAPTTGSTVAMPLMTLNEVFTLTSDPQPVREEVSVSTPPTPEIILNKDALPSANLENIGIAGADNQTPLLQQALDIYNAAHPESFFIMVDGKFYSDSRMMYAGAELQAFNQILEELVNAD